MVFSSTVFLFVFLPVTLLGYYILPKAVENYWLLAVSLIFFAWAQPKYLWIILLNVAINYVGALLVDRTSEKKGVSKSVLAITIAANLALLFYFKYFNFTIDTINQIFRSGLTFEKVILPIGISFFTFQGLSYVVDVYRGEVAVQKNLFKEALYITLFPQLVAGPIVRYKDIESEITEHSQTLSDFASGIERFIIGLGKKAIIANTMATVADGVWDAGPGNVLPSVAWLGTVAYTFQIFFDFSGYSDMAIGLGRMFGFHFNENFNLPYISTSISEFWRRWHISLSSWFRDYVYIPLGGNRNHVYRNLGIVFLLTGIWHGAAWNFVLWGIWNGIFILAERAAGVNKKRNKTAPQKIIGWIYSIAVVHFGWILFRAPDLTAAIDMVKNMFGVYDSGNVDFALGWYLDGWVAAVMFMAALFSSSLPRKFVENLKGSLKADIILPINYIGLILVFAFSVMRIVAGTYNPFIYFQF